MNNSEDNNAFLLSGQMRKYILNLPEDAESALKLERLLKWILDSDLHEKPVANIGEDCFFDVVKIFTESASEKYSKSLEYKKRESKRMQKKRLQDKNVREQYANSTRTDREQCATNKNKNMNTNKNTNKNINNKKEIDKESSAFFESEFLRFWESYPKKQDKKKAHDKFIRILKESKVTADEIIKAVQEQNRLKWSKDDPKFIPMPSTWLNGQRWDDDLGEKEKEEAEQKKHDETSKRMEAFQKSLSMI